MIATQIERGYVITSKNGWLYILVLGGETTLILLNGNEEQRYPLSTGKMLVIPKDAWPRFESPEGVKVMTITPQPTEHSIEQPNGT